MQSVVNEVENYEKAIFTIWQFVGGTTRESGFVVEKWSVKMLVALFLLAL